MPGQFTLGGGIVHGPQQARDGVVNGGSVHGDVYNSTVNNQCYDNRRNTYTINGGSSIVNGDLNGTQNNTFSATRYPQGNFDYRGRPGSPPVHGEFAIVYARETFKDRGPDYDAIARRHSMRGQASKAAIRRRIESQRKTMSLGTTSDIV